MVTKKLTTTLGAIFAFLLIGIMSASCNSDSNSGGLPADLCVDFATFTKTSDNGSVFTLRKSADSELVTLTAAVKIDTEKLKPGSRVIIHYLPSGGQQPYQSGPIDLYGISEIQNGTPEKASLSTIEGWPSERLKMMSLTRSGQYLDVWAELSFSSKPERFVLAVDEATLSDEYPQLYIVFTSDNSIGRIRQYYASFDLSSVWDLPTCKGVSVNYEGTAGNESVKFDKPGREPITPGEDPGAPAK